MVFLKKKKKSVLLNKQTNKLIFSKHKYCRKILLNQKSLFYRDRVFYLFCTPLFLIFPFFFQYRLAKPHHYFFFSFLFVSHFPFLPTTAVLICITCSDFNYKHIFKCLLYFSLEVFSVLNKYGLRCITWQLCKVEGNQT